MPVSRLKKRKDFVRIAGAGNKWVSPSLILQIAPRIETSKIKPEMNHSWRVGFTASRKVGNAIKRNRAKRRLRAAVNKIFVIQAKDGYDYVVIARSQLTECPYDQILKDLKFCLSGVHRNLSRIKTETINDI